MKDTTVLAVMLLVLFIGLVYKFAMRTERFDKDMTEFVDIWEPRYGLRGERLDVHPLYDCRYDRASSCYNSHI